MELTAIILNHWTQLRGMTYDLIDRLELDNLQLRLGFERSQNIGYQFWCMLGSQESWIALMETGQWQGFSCSLDSLEGDLVLENIRTKMQQADQTLLKAIREADLTATFENGTTPLSHYLILVEHEAHHQGQLINFIYAHDLPIPESWEAKWALRRD